MTSTACAANAVDVGVKIICSGREIKIDDVGHLSNVQSAGCYICGNQNLGISSAESRQGTLSLALCAIPMNGQCIHCHLAGQHLAHPRGCTLLSHEHKGAPRRLPSLKSLEQELHFVLFVCSSLNNALFDGIEGGAHSANSNPHVRRAQELGGKLLNGRWECGAEHESLSVFPSWQITPEHYLPDLRLEAHVQHAVCLIQHQILGRSQGYQTTLQEICQAPRGCHQDLTAMCHLAQLCA
mmetsp:Transcript_46975/g.77138  ORF Transcript_46975/g.77138 Transcript_46975/m.77138 type:complete len:239 (-) Transcript_46975:715-1431(-)